MRSSNRAITRHDHRHQTTSSFNLETGLIYGEAGMSLSAMASYYRGNNF